jgi:hypothetical protein
MNITEVKGKQGEFEVTNRARKRIDDAREIGLTGKELGDETFKIKMEEEGRKFLSEYVKPDENEKMYLRKQLIDTGRIRNFVMDYRGNRLDKFIYSTQKLVDIMKKVNCFGIVFPNLQKFYGDIKLPCEILEGANAWISKDCNDPNGVYRYFSKKDGITKGMSIFDLIEIVDGVGIGKKEGFIRKRNIIPT